MLGGWQVSGIYLYQTGIPETIGFSIPGIGNNNLTGSFTEGARLRLVGDPATGFDRDPYHNINPAAFLPPTAGSTANPLAQIGMEAPNCYFIRPGINDWTFSIQKSFTMSENVRLQLRADAFNAFNHTQSSDYNRTANFASLTSNTVTNLPRLENGRWINPTGFGAVTSVRDPRNMQLMARFQF